MDAGTLLSTETSRVSKAMKIVSVALERYCDKIFSRDSQRSSSLTIPVTCLFNSFLSPVQTTTPRREKVESRKAARISSCVIHLQSGGSWGFSSLPPVAPLLSPAWGTRGPGVRILNLKPVRVCARASMCAYVVCVYTHVCVVCMDFEPIVYKYKYIYIYP